MARREKFQKTNAMRELEAAGVPFSYETYEVDETDTSNELGLHIALRLGEDPAASFKTLVCVTPAGEHVVCCIPVADEPGVLAQVARIFAEQSISIESLFQPEAVIGEKDTEIVVMTHSAVEGAVTAAIEAIEALAGTRGKVVMIRKEELN